MSVIHVAKPSLESVTKSDMLRYILERNHTSVIHVVNPSLEPVT